MSEISETPINALIFLLFLIAIVFLQFKLSKSESKVPGLVLPVLSFLTSILGVVGYASFMFLKIPQMEVNGEIVQEAVYSMDSIEKWVGLFMIFLVLNVPTLILYAIYSSERKKQKRNKDIDRMRIEDLS